jgi:ribonuclease G
MENESNREKVMARLSDWAKRDRTKCTVFGWTRLGLLELTRRKARDNAARQISERCPACGGTGKRTTVNS